MKFLERFWFGCGHCHGGDGCPMVDSVNPETGEPYETVHGPRLIGTVILVFVLPLITAVGGAYLGGIWSADASKYLHSLAEVIGAVGGFLVGVGLAKLVFWTRDRRLPADGGR
jgi:hypothetical protein